MESEIKCSNKKHSEINAVRFCQECNIYLCNKCLNYHSELHENHKAYNIDKKIQEIFTGICGESNHKAPLEFYCKSHNKLCCSSCLSKLKGKENGQHFNCEVCLIEEIKEEKKIKLNENLKYMEEEGKKFAQEINAVFKRTSALEGTGIEDLFNELVDKYLNEINHEIKKEEDIKDNNNNIKITKEVQKQKPKSKKC